MKAQEILMYLFAFNVATTLIGNLNLFLVSNYSSGLLTFLTIPIVAGFIGILAVYGIVNFISTGATQRSPQGYIYYLYGFVYVAFLANTTIVLGSIVLLLPNPPPELQAFGFLILTAFDLFCAWAFMAGISQMVSGGWRSMK